MARDTDSKPTEMLALLNHELRTPLTSIRSAIGLLKSGVTGPMTAESTEILELAERSVFRLQEVVNDLLHVSRHAQDAAAPLELKSVALDRIIARAVAQASATARSVGVSIESADTDLRVRANATYLADALTRLLLNALQHSPLHATVDVRCRLRGAAVRIEVSDRGPGLPEGFRQQDFHAFEQASTGDARSHNGLGIGLAISEQIARAHGGRLGATRRRGGGSIFWIELPVAPRA